MAKYTVELRDVVSEHNIFAFPYPFYDEKKRKDFQDAFIRHFYFREIGVKTPERFIFHLWDKMVTVFPYYNELLKTAELEYSVLDNYNVTETFTRNMEKLEKASGVFSSRGQVTDSQNSEVENEQNRTGTTNDTETSSNTGVSEQSNTGTKNTDTDGTKTREATRHTDHDENIVKKFLDTPQGAIDLKDIQYLTTLNDDTVDNQEFVDEGETATDKTNIKETHSENGTANITNNGERNLSGNSTEKTDGKTSSNFEGEQRTIHDNNTRSEKKDDVNENYTLKKQGNIGVDTDADMIQKHIKLQKILTRIYGMFFDECEDLFMMVL